MVESKQLKRTKTLSTSYLYYLTKTPNILIKEWYPNYTLQTITFPALVKTDQYYLITDNETDYNTVKSKNTKSNFPNLYLIRRELL